MSQHQAIARRGIIGSNAQVDCHGLAGDTVHMARLWSSSRKGKLNYSLGSLSTYAPPVTVHGYAHADVAGPVQHCMPAAVKPAC